MTIFFSRHLSSAYSLTSVIPANAGTQRLPRSSRTLSRNRWVPACAGMTNFSFSPSPDHSQLPNVRHPGERRNPAFAPLFLPVTGLLLAP
ncbi:MAG: hypothetical protein EOP91_15005 [Lysobacteraceae bacterium]|nr:MAG: hypothetical protein EOP91_15005 [Xanthomonadaceae bacterium]